MTDTKKAAPHQDSDLQHLPVNNNTYLIIANINIRTDTEGRYNLNDLHKASGLGASKAPAQWMRLKSAKALIDAASANEAHVQIHTSKNGENKGTYASDVIAISYAGWLSPEFQIRVNKVFIDYRSGALQQARQLSRKDILLMALESEEKIQRLESDIQIMQPKVSALNKIANVDKSFCVRDTAKMLQMRPKDLTSWLHANGWIYQQMPSTNWLGYSAKTKVGYLEHKTVMYDGSDGSARATTQVRITAKGLTKLATLTRGEK